MKYGPETPTVEAFLRHLKGMTKKQWAEVEAAAPTARGAAFYAARDAARDAALDAAARDAAARDAAWYAAEAVWIAVWDAAGYAALDAAGYTTCEILGASLMRERGQPFYFLPMFGFADPEAVLETDKKRTAG